MWWHLFTFTMWWHLSPMHYGTFPLLTGTVEAFKASLGTQVTLKAPAPGDTVEL